MTRGKKGKRGKKGLGETPVAASKSGNAEMSREKIGYAVLSFFGGAMVASALNNTSAGKFAGLAGVLTGGFGAWKKNLYATSFGAGMFFSTVSLPKPAEGTNGIDDQDMLGFNMKTITDNTKSYFQNLGQKLMLKTAEQPATTPTETTNGLNGEEEVKYFINPYSQKSNELDLSALNAIEQQMEQMNNSSELENSGMNF